jgi:hypothetical protein
VPLSVVRLAMRPQTKIPDVHRVGRGCRRPGD